MTRVTAPSRLHFGLLHVPVEGFTHWPDGRPMRKYGGVGLMINAPAVVVTAEASGTDEVSGSLASRAGGFLQQVRSHRPALGPVKLTANGPPEHVGFGTGTALGLAVASAVVPGYWDAANNLPYPVTEAALAPLVGRGQRSGIGVAGFEDGGFIVDHGKPTYEGPAEIGVRLDFPPTWHVVLVRPPVPPIWHGDRERAAFGRERSVIAAAATTACLQSLASDVLVPAVGSGDFETFAEGVYEFNRRAGEPFRQDQGGTYAGPVVEGVIATLRRRGVNGVGQSSWGPTVFAFAPDGSIAHDIERFARAAFSGDCHVAVTTANNRGAVHETT